MRISILYVFFIVLMGCASNVPVRESTTPVSGSTATTRESTTPTPPYQGGELLFDPPRQSATATPQEGNFILPDPPRQSATATPQEGNLFEDVYFEFDRADIGIRERVKVQFFAEWLVGQDGRVVVEGHADERGDYNYNLALSERRAVNVRDFLVALGVSPERIEVVSYGEERPVCFEASEECWGLNRRVEFGF